MYVWLCEAVRARVAVWRGVQHLFSGGIWVRCYVCGVLGIHGVGSGTRGGEAFSNCNKWGYCHTTKVGQGRIHMPFVTITLEIN